MARALLPIGMICCCLVLAAPPTIPGAFHAWAAEPEHAAGQSLVQAGGGESTEPPAPLDCRQLADLLQQQRQFIAKEIGQVKREVAAMRDDLAKPGVQEIFAGIGYLLGLAGVGLYVHCRRKYGNG